MCVISVLCNSITRVNWLLVWLLVWHLLGLIFNAYWLSNLDYKNTENERTMDSDTELLIGRNESHAVGITSFEEAQLFELRRTNQELAKINERSMKKTKKGTCI